MHAFLISYSMSPDLAITDLSVRLKTKILEFPIQKMDDAKRLNSFLRLEYSEPTLIVCRNIENATEETVNAFLKNLEEPQKNIFFALTTTAVSKVLPTIVSRCQIIYDTAKKEKGGYHKSVTKFLDLSFGEKITFYESIKEREKAVLFLEEFISYIHEGMHDKNSDLKNNAEVAIFSVNTLKNIKANGNVNLQLTNLAVKLSSNPLRSPHN